MEENLNKLIALSQKYGQNPDYIIAGGGNSSYKTDGRMWVKASGTSMANINKDGFVCLDREKMQVISQKKYSEDAAVREQEVKQDLHQAILFPEGKRPSVEASMHEIINYPFVMHTHPTLVNGVLCAQQSKEVIEQLFGDEVIYVPYTDPGYVLFKEVEAALKKYRTEKNKESQVIYLENHGVFVGADTCKEIERIYAEIEDALLKSVKGLPSDIQLDNTKELEEISNKIQFEQDDTELYMVTDNSELTNFFVENKDVFDKVSIPFTPDNIVYCKSKYLFVPDINQVKDLVTSFKYQNSYFPKVIAIREKGIIAIEDSLKSAQIVLDVFKDMMKVSYLSEFFGGPRPMSQEQIDFIDNWEVENYRRKMSKANG